MKNKFATIPPMPPSPEPAFPPFSIAVFGTLTTVFLASLAVFYELVRRFTRGRHQIAVGDWARAHRADLRAISVDDLPAPLASLSPEIRMSVRSENAHLLSLTIHQRRWNVLCRQSTAEWIPSGLRPATHENSLLDAMSLQVFPAYSTSERFHLVSADNLAARKLSKSSARALIPADIGLLLWGKWIILDFTHRPFDPIEFGRMIALVEQLVTALPQ